AGAAFYGGMIYQRQKHFTMADANAQPSPSPQSTLASKRASVDADPKKWLADTIPTQLTKESIPKPADSKDPEFLYLYGRALMLTGDHRDAMQAFELALSNSRSNSNGDLPLDTEVRLANAAAALKLNKESATPRSQETAMAE